MFQNHRLIAIFSTAALLLIGSSVALLSQTAGRPPALIHERPAVIHDRIDESKLVTLAGNTRPEAAAENDLGPVSDGLSLDHMLLQLQRSPEQELAAARFIEELHSPQSPNFHKWQTAGEFGKSYGLADSDIRAVTSWLESHGFKVNVVYPSGTVIDFSGTAGQVRRAFHTSIHNLDVNGTHHIANFGDPQIPEALAPALAGVVSMHDFRPHMMVRPQYTISSTSQAVVPADLATIYDFNPLFNKGITGSGQTVAVIEDTDVYQRADWVTFRGTFGLSQYTSGTLTSVHPPPGANCIAPGIVAGPDEEAAVDAEWASAAAPGATIEVASCADTNVTFGGFLAMQNLVNGSSPPAIVSISYGGCEVAEGAATNSFINTLYQQAVAEGVSVFVAAGDGGAASCDQDEFIATHGISVSGFASTPYNVAVGGTDFSDVFNSTTSTYWSATNGAGDGSAKSYIPEIPWNDSCAGSLLASYMGYATGYGQNGFCYSSAAGNFLTVVAGGGGPSNCATGSPSPTAFSVASGSCKGWPKPSWQTGLPGIANDGVRDIPDVSMFASDGNAWGHYLVFCFSDANVGGTPCTGAPSNWSGTGGTSFSSPVMAGIQALVNQSTGSRQGNPNPVYYSLAKSVPSAFHSITQGDITVDCVGPYNCYGFVGTVDYGRNGRIFGTTFGGALSASDSSFQPAYGASGSSQSGPSWNFATGIGSVDANILVTNWPK